jgi:four helix bundle protein
MGERIERFEDLIAWKKARALTSAIYRATAVSSYSTDYVLKNQMRRATVSIMANIAEGFERMRPTEFHQFLSIAKGSCAELRSQLYVALDAGHLDQAEFDLLLEQTSEVGRILGGLRAAVSQRR